MYKHRHRGEKPRLAASEINLWNQSTVDLQSLRHILTTSQRERDELAWTVSVRNDTAAQLAIGDTLAIDKVIMPLAIDDTVDLVFSLKNVTTSDDIPCVLVEPIRPGFIGQAVVAGLVKAKFDGTDFTTQGFAQPKIGNVLEPATSGSIKLLVDPPAGVTMQPVVLGAGGGGGTARVSLVYFELTSDLAANVGATATANAFADNTLTGATTAIAVTNPGRFRSFTGATGVAVKLANGSYWIVHVDQPALTVLAVLVANPGTSVGAPKYGADPRDAEAYISLSPLPQLMTPYPFSFRHATIRAGASGKIDNSLRLMGEAGDLALLGWNPTTDAYTLVAVYPATQREFWATLQANRPNGLSASMTCVPETPIEIGSMPANPVTVRDEFNVAIGALANNRVLAKWDARNQRYVAVEAVHRSTKVMGTVSSWTGENPTTFNLTPTVTFDGATPGGITIQNSFGWRQLAVGTRVMAERSSDGNWYPISLPATTLRVKPDKSALQMSFDNGSTWFDWATVGECKQNP